MARAVSRKTRSLSMRLLQGDLAMIDRAARLEGRSRTDFVRDAAIRAAEEVLVEHGLIRMSPDGFDAFHSVLCVPAIAVPEMLTVVRRPAPWEAEGVGE